MNLAARNPRRLGAVVAVGALVSAVLVTTPRSAKADLLPTKSFGLAGQPSLRRSREGSWAQNEHFSTAASRDRQRGVLGGRTARSLAGLTWR